MRRWLAAAVLLSLAVGASAQPNPAASAPGSAPPAGSAAPAPSAPEPPAPTGDPHANVGLPAIPRDESAPAPELGAGTVEVLIRDATRQPLSGVKVRLGILYQKISEGESRSERFATTDASGTARFSGLNAASEYSYRVTVQSGPAEYSSVPFALTGGGHRVTLHVFPVTTEVADAPVGMRGFVYIEPRDDVFQFEVLFRIFNVGGVTWVPKDIILELPKGFKAFSNRTEMSDGGFEAAEKVGVRLKGSFTPGQQDVGFRFQVPKDPDPNATFRMGILPRVAELRVIAEASSQMSLNVDGFETPQISANQQGKRVLVTRKLFSRGEELTSFTIGIAGLPVPGPGRWIAVLIASGLALLGFAAYRGVVRLDGAEASKRNRDLENAREILLSELVEVEKARRRGDLGPRAHAEARRTLLDALARLGQEALTPRRTKKQRAAA